MVEGVNRREAYHIGAEAEEAIDVVYGVIGVKESIAKPHLYRIRLSCEDGRHGVAVALRTSSMGQIDQNKLGAAFRLELTFVELSCRLVGVLKVSRHCLRRVARRAATDSTQGSPCCILP